MRANQVHHRFLSDADAERFGISLVERAECIEEINTEISIYLGMMYLMVEVLKELDDFSEELSEHRVYSLILFVLRYSQ